MYFVAMPATGAQGVVQPGFNYFTGSQTVNADGTSFNNYCPTSGSCTSSPYETSSGNCMCDRTDSAGQTVAGAYSLADVGLTGASDGYCDAQGGNGAFCPEVDIFEGNQVAAQFSSHACKAVTKTNSGVNGVTGPFFPECDQVRGSCLARRDDLTALSLSP
jgi:hypothetical protein